MMYSVSIWMRCPSVWMPNPLGNRSLGRNADFRFLREIFRLMRFLRLKILPTVRAETTVPWRLSMAASLYFAHAGYVLRKATVRSMIGDPADGTCRNDGSLALEHGCQFVLRPCRIRPAQGDGSLDDRLGCHRLPHSLRLAGLFVQTENPLFHQSREPTKECHASYAEVPRGERPVPAMRSMPIDNPEATFCLLGKFVFPVG